MIYIVWKQKDENEVMETLKAISGDPTFLKKKPLTRPWTKERMIGSSNFNTLESQERALAILGNKVRFLTEEPKFNPFKE